MRALGTGATTAVIGILAGLIALPATAGPSSYLGVSVGEELWTGSVAAEGREVVASVPENSEVIIVVSGTFEYSGTGRQDALYRWHVGKDDHISPCETHKTEGRRYAFVIDGECHLPVGRKQSEHVYVYNHKVGENGLVKFRINDNLTYDNNGELALRIFAKPEGS